MLEFTNELARFAIQRATARDTRAVERCRDTVEAIQGQMLQVGLAWLAVDCLCQSSRARAWLAGCAGKEPCVLLSL